VLASGNAYFASYQGTVRTLNLTAKVGQGTIIVQPSALLLFSGTGNLNAGQLVEVRSNLSNYGVIGMADNSPLASYNLRTPFGVGASAPSVGAFTNSLLASPQSGGGVLAIGGVDRVAHFQVELGGHGGRAGGCDQTGEKQSRNFHGVVSWLKKFGRKTQSVGSEYSSALKTVWNTLPSNMAIKSLDTSRLSMRTAEAKAIQLKGEATAAAMRAQAVALSANPVLVEMKKAESWDGKLPTAIYAGAPIPFMNIGK
jgi:hypothetical protein